MSEESLFNLALEKPAQERSAFLEIACAGDIELRRRVERLLQAHENPSSFLQEPILQSTGTPPTEATLALDPSKTDPPDSGQTQSELHKSAIEDLAFLAPSARPDSLGRLEHYHILEIIGKGGFGTVLKAFDERLHRVVAIKTLSLELSASGTARQRFIREARTAAAVTHEHVVTIHAVVEEHRPPYLVMQLIDGQTLQEKLDKVGMLSLREILRIGMQMAEGLAAAHKQGLVHRDIKPANMLLENGVERVKITDFGLAKIADDASVTQSGVVAGTPMYMSPEQANGEPLDHRSDLFSLGTVLYVMCTGRPPFRASGTMGVLKRVIDDTPRPVREINPELPDWLEDIINKLHAKKPEDRFQTAKEVAEVLGQRLADVQAGREIQRASGVSRGSEAPANITQPPPAHAGGSPLRRRAYAVLAIFATIAAGLTITELTNVTHFFHTPHYWINLGVDDPNITISIWRVKPGETEPDLAAGGDGQGLLMFQHKGERRISLAAGDYWFLARQDDRKVVHYERVTVDRSRVVLINWAAALAKKNAGDLKTEPGWVQLFNGKNLEGWSLSNPENGSVEDGALALKSPCYASWGGRYRNFHLRTEVKVNAGGTGAIDFRHELGETASAPISTNKEYGFTGTVIWGKKGQPTHYLAGPEKELVPADTWCTLEIVARGKQVVVRVNGVTTADAPIAELAKEGRIVFSARNHKPTTIHFRKIVLKELPPEIKELPPEAPGWVQLFNGNDLTGWEADDAAIWKVENGIVYADLPKSAKKPSFLTYMAKNYGDFELQADMKFEKGGYGHWHFRTKDRRPHGGYQWHPDGELVSGPLNVRLVQGTRPNLPDDWYTRTIIAQGAHITFKHMGEIITDFHDPSYAKHLPSGKLHIQVNPGTKLALRNVRIKELPPEKPGWVQLFNGKDLDAWDASVKDKWTIKDSILRGTGKSWLISKNSFSNFHLRATMRYGIKSQASIVFRTTRNMHGELGMGGANFTFGLYADGKVTNASRSKNMTKAYEWYDLDLIVRGSKATVMINGVFAAEATIPELPSSGRIHLSAYTQTTSFEFKSVEIKELPPDEPGWVQIFNGKDLDGWGPTVKDSWTVKDAILRGKGRSGLYSKKFYGDFHLRATARCNAKSLASIAFRASSGTHGELGMGGPTVALGLHATGKTTETARSKPVTQANEWFDFDLIVRGKKVVVKINNVLAAESTLDQLRPTGQINLNAYTPGTVFEFKKIEIKELPPDEPGWVQLFNGKDLTGWTGDTKVWTWKNGALVGAKVRDGSIQMHSLRHQATWRDFDLKFQASLDNQMGQAAVTVRGKAGMHIGPKRDVGSFSTDWGDPGKLTATMNQADLKKALKADFNDFTIKCVGKRVTVSVNGVTTIDREFADLPAQGPIAFKLFQGTSNTPNLSIRNVEIRQLAPQTDPGWVPLFNSRTLDGWKTANKFDWLVQNGVLVAETKQQSAELVSARENFENFHLRAQVKLQNTATPARAGIWFRLGPDNKGYHGQLSSAKGEGGVLSLGEKPATPTPFRAMAGYGIKENEWFDYEIIASGTNVATRVNGIETSRVSDPRFRRGRISLEVYPNSRVMFQSIEIKELPHEPTEWVPLFNAKDLDGWKEIDKGVWSVEKGELMARSEGNLISLLMSQRDDVASFHLRGQAKLAAAEGQGKAGIWVRLDKELGGYGAFLSTGPGETGVLITREKASDKLKTPAAKPAATIPPNTWFDFDVIADGTNITVKVNGKVTGQLTGATRRQGWIALERWRGTVVHFRKIEIKELPPRQPAPNANTDFGKWTDPKGDCKHEIKDGVLTITIPPGVHKLDPKRAMTYAGVPMDSGNQVAPRLLHEVEGDFTLEVTVRDMNAQGKGALEKGFYGAGLVLWQDQDHFLKLLRRPNGALVIAFAKGGFAGGFNRAGTSPTALRIERRGKSCILQISSGGKGWATLSDVNLGHPFSKWTLPSKLHVGVIAENDTGQSVDFRFENFRLKLASRGPD